MATLEKRARGSFRLIFKFGGERYAFSLKTADLRIAEASRARVEDQLRRVSLGTLRIPPDADGVAVLFWVEGLALPARRQDQCRVGRADQPLVGPQQRVQPKAVLGGRRVLVDDVELVDPVVEGQVGLPDRDQVLKPGRIIRSPVALPSILGNAVAWICGRLM
jgi:hypothetical protein